MVHEPVVGVGEQMSCIAVMWQPAGEQHVLPSVPSTCCNGTEHGATRLGRSWENAWLVTKSALCLAKIPSASTDVMVALDAR
jgi:hypothetical protein